MTMMTTQDRHNEEGRLALELYGPCPHGRPRGFSNYDVAFCGRCEAEMAAEAEAELFLEELDARLAAGVGYPFAIGPVRGGLDGSEDEMVLFGEDRPEPLTDDLPF